MSGKKRDRLLVNAVSPVKKKLYDPDERLNKAHPPCFPIMRLSILCPTTPPTGLGGARWGFVILASTKAPPHGATLADKSPLIPCIGGGAAVGKWGMEENGAV